MKRLAFILSFLFIFLTANTTMATGLGIQAGMATSAFENQTSSANTFVGGAHFVFDLLPLIDLGAEYTLTISPFSFQSDYAGQTYTSDISQSYFGAFARIFLPLPLIVIDPYLKAGVGYYSGKIKTSGAGESQTFDLKSTLGYSVGIGLKSVIGLYGEFIYNFAKQELDGIPDPDTLAYNNWMIMVGYSFGL
ncbi:MAG TPA: hypothetical protein EYP36_09550 [Calditrichaeota bacterium]|nr:hypothetical protein [Calditrichota bacterium]